VSTVRLHDPLPHPPRVRGPGLGWLPAVWRRSATWRTVGRFVLWGPLIGGAPYAVLVFTIPFAYAIGLGPALLSGLLFAAWYHGSAGRMPTWPWRAVMGALCGAAPMAVLAFCNLVASQRPGWLSVGVIAAHGIPAATILALTQNTTQSAERARPAQPAQAAPHSGAAAAVRH
jgi:hypothetical protein